MLIILCVQVNYLYEMHCTYIEIINLILMFENCRFYSPPSVTEFRNELNLCLVVDCRFKIV
jgi:hypothetical protein